MSVWILEEKEPYWPEWQPKELLPWTSVYPWLMNHLIEVRKLSSVSKSADFRVTEYVRKEA